MEGRLVIYVDIDGTICHTQGSDYQHCTPILENIDKINALFDQGHKIVYWTARGTVTGLDWYNLTENQLNLWGAKYTQLKMGKPAYDLFIDDKNINSEDYFK